GLFPGSHGGRRGPHARRGPVDARARERRRQNFDLARRTHRTQGLAMAEIAPFRGILYRATGEADKLLAPPYDVLSVADRARYAALHPRNVVELILPAGEGDAKYAHAGELWRLWQSDGTLGRDQRPALYRYHQTFEAEGRTHTRKGVIALL